MHLWELEFLSDDGGECSGHRWVVRIFRKFRRYETRSAYKHVFEGRFFLVLLVHFLFHDGFRDIDDEYFLRVVRQIDHAIGKNLRREMSRYVLSTRAGVWG